jgi:hypothetical protein
MWGRRVYATGTTARPIAEAARMVSDADVHNTPTPKGGAGGEGRTRRAVLALLLALAAWPPTGGRAAQEHPRTGIAVEALAGVETEGLTGPLFLGLAKLVIPPGVGTEAGDTPGPRLLAVEAGYLTVVTTRPSVVTVAARQGVPGGPEDRAAGTLVVGPGERLALPDGGAREIRNDGARPVVFLDAALFPPGPDPLLPAFTTPEGLVFQLRAGATVEAVPTGRLRVSLSRVYLARLGALPAAPWPGPAIAYVDTGVLELEPTGGEVRYARAAAATANSTGGAVRPVAVGSRLTVTAGGSVVLATGAAIEARNPRAAPVVVLLLEVAPAAGAA